MKTKSFWVNSLAQTGAMKSVVSYLGVNLTAVSALILTLTGCSSGSPGDISTSSNGGATCTTSGDSRLSTCTGTLGLVQNDSVQTAQASSLSAPTLTLAFTVTPPTVNGTALQADDVYVNGTNAFVSYNTSGGTLVGGVDPISVLVPNVPVLGTGITFSDTKINALYQNGTTLYAAGANNNYGALMNTLSLNTLFNLISSSFVQANLHQSFAGTGITTGPGGALIVTTGDGSVGNNGGVFSYSASALSTASAPTTGSPSIPTPAWSSTIADARATLYDSVVANNALWTITGANGVSNGGKLIRLNATSGATVATYAVGGNDFTQSKSTIVQGTNTILVSLGDGGAKIVCKADGVTMASIPAAVVSGYTAGQIPTNAAAAAPGIMLLANGDAGVYVYYMTNALISPSTHCTQGVTVTYQGAINFGSTLSANNVFWDGTAFFVAAGLGGFKVVTAASLNLLNAFSL